MVTFLHEETANMVGFKLQGSITAEDIGIIVDILEKKFESEEKVNLYIEVEEDLDESFGGILEHAKKAFTVVLPNLGKIKKIAMIADKERIQKIMDYKDLFFTIELRGFQSIERESAHDWVKA